MEEEEGEAIHHVGVIVSFPRGGAIMSRALGVLREERALLQRQLSAVDRAIAALSGGLVSSGRKVGVKKHGRVWTPAMKAAASKRAKARWAKKGKMK
jgi:hypothetical protein